MAYASGKRKYLSFCAQFHYKPLPVEESTLLHFVAFLFSSSLNYSSIRLYLCAVRHLQIMGNLPDPALTAFPKLNYALRGLRREGPRLHTCPRLPITPELLRKIHQVWSQQPKGYNQMMLWAAFCLPFCIQGNSLAPLGRPIPQICFLQVTCQSTHMLPLRMWPFI